MKNYILLIAALLLGVAGFLVGHRNQLTAQKQVDTIVLMDQQGTATQRQQDELEQYAKNHSGINVTYTLQASYQRAQDAVAAANAAAQGANAHIYTDAQAACAGRADSITQAKCNQEYLAAHLQAVPTAPTPMPNPADYTHMVTGPKVTTDLAGAFFLGAGVALVLGLISLLSAGRKHRF